MLVSFIVTSYNYSKYILETIQSIKNQTIDDFEIIVVDDCSKDNSVEILEQQIGIKLIKHKKNEGQLASIITGLKEAQGQYICIIDSDDTITQNYAERLLEHITHNNVSLVVCNGNKNEILTPDTHPFGGWWWQPMSCGMFKREVLEPILNYSNASAWKICPDKFLFNLAHLLGNSMNVTDILVYKRKHTNNAGKHPFRFFINVKNNFIIRNEALKIISHKVHRTKIKKSYSFLFMQIVEKLDNIMSFKR